MNKNPIISYLSKITFFSILVCFVIMLLWFKVPADYLRSAPYYVCMYYFVTFAFWIYLYMSIKKGTRRMEHAYMISKIAKFLIYVVVFAVVLLFDLEKNTKFAFAYLGLYVCYQVFDTVTVMKLMKNKDIKSDKQ